LRPVFDTTRGADGFVSIEVSPYLAMDTQGTIDEAKRLWREVDRTNLMIKVPATSDGLPAIHDLTAEGINVNITLLFAQQVYEQVVEAYLSGLEALAAKGGEISRIAALRAFSSAASTPTWINCSTRKSRAPTTRTRRPASRR